RRLEGAAGRRPSERRSEPDEIRSLPARRHAPQERSAGRSARPPRHDAHPSRDIRFSSQAHVGGILYEVEGVVRVARLGLARTLLREARVSVPERKEHRMPERSISRGRFAAGTAATLASIAVIKAPARAAQWNYKNASNVSLAHPLNLRMPECWN